MRTDFDTNVWSGLGKRAQAGPEAYGQTHVVAPIRRAYDLCSADAAPRYIRDQADARRGETGPRSLTLHLRHHRLDESGMEGVRDGEPARFYTLAAQPGAQIIDRAGRTGDDDLYRTVLCGNRDRQTASIDGIVDQSLRGKTAAMPPPGGRDCMRRPRAATSCSASGSSRTPATVAATYSPIECPSPRSAQVPTTATPRSARTRRRTARAG